MTVGGNGAAPPPAAYIGHKFVKDYYTVLAKEPENLHKFYKAQSVFSRSTEGAGCEGTISAVGAGEIHSEVMSFVGSFDRLDCRAELLHVECQESRHGGVLVCVTGCLTYTQSSERQHFTQALFLDRQSEPYDGYFVLNDILRYISPDGSSKVAAPAAPTPVPGAAPLPQTLGPAPTIAPQPQHQPQVMQAEPLPAPPSVDEQEGGTDDTEEAFPEVEAVDAEEEFAAEAEAEAEVEGEDEEEDRGAEEEEAHAEAAQVEESVRPQRNWADVASMLKSSGPGNLSTSTKRGWGLLVLPPPTAAAKAEAARAVQRATGTKGKPDGADDTGPALMHLSPSKEAQAASSSAPCSSVKLWLSRLPAERPGDNEELVDTLNALLLEGGNTAARVLEVDRTDAGRDWGYLVVANQESADAVVQLSKEKQINLQSRTLKAEYIRSSGGYGGSGGGSSSRSGGKSGGKSGGNSGGKGEDGEKAKGQSKKGSKGGGKDGGGKDGGGNGTFSAEDGSRPRGGGKRFGKGGKAGEGKEWRSSVAKGDGSGIAQT
eukprot:CAMPEP_0177193078 /NCGR_PEP_ID=MMETSP0367-20130122/22245_1 /TAXON_ID=447022 ORGANISM="Scrippsiella hangoei-like, Strain SHHI-4" /NCGR_SAMPLE_ID=MMETSP0367 /ASSEMBLY_ACC=CAM_ASM_000362 /LENGTH=542 /DNA_ID=CAMNT_0018640929 /DNA_START=37 /DNA_END=1665 /DNA_ORIENTATION=-